MDAAAEPTGGTGVGELPMLGDRPGAAPRRRDLAQGRVGLVLWGAPIALILVSSAVLSAGWVPEVVAGLLLVLGTVWFGGTCLVNGLRCGGSIVSSMASLCPSWPSLAF